MRAIPATKCIFCGSPNLTKEHVFSSWTHKFMGPRKSGRALSFRGTQHIDEVTRSIVKMAGQVRDWQVRCVCGGTNDSCNNGWMRKIENRAMRSMTPLIIGKETRIGPSDQIAIAAWAALKVMVAERGVGLHVTTHHKHRRYMMDHSLPPERGWGVWIGSYEREKWVPEWMSRPILLLPDKVVAKRVSRKPTHYNTKSTTQVIGKLFIQVIHTPMPTLIQNWRFATPQGGTLFRIWPRTEISIKWPANVLTDLDADTVANALADFSFNAATKRRAHDALI